VAIFPFFIQNMEKSAKVIWDGEWFQTFILIFLIIGSA